MRRLWYEVFFAVGLILLLLIVSLLMVKDRRLERKIDDLTARVATIEAALELDSVVIQFDVGRDTTWVVASDSDSSMVNVRCVVPAKDSGER